MHRGAVAVALVLAVSGCSGFVAGGGDAVAETLTPAPVPTATGAHGAPEGTPTECAAPRPATPDQSRLSPPGTPATPVPVPTSDGVVSGERLVEINAAALRNTSYRLRASDSMEVRALENATAFSYRGSYATTFLVAYAVNGTLYSVDLASERVKSVRREPYRPGSGRNRIVPSEMVSLWLGDVIGPYNYTYVGTREWNGTTVRVFEARLREPKYVRLQKVVALNSTVYVDRRGIVRRVDHSQRYRNVLGENTRTSLRNETLVVSDVGSVRIERPDGLCGPVAGE